MPKWAGATDSPAWIGIDSDRRIENRTPQSTPITVLSGVVSVVVVHEYAPGGNCWICHDRRYFLFLVHIIGIRVPGVILQVRLTFRLVDSQSGS